MERIKFTCCLVWLLSWTGGCGGPASIAREPDAQEDMPATPDALEPDAPLNADASDTVTPDMQPDGPIECVPDLDAIDGPGVHNIVFHLQDPPSGVTGFVAVSETDTCSPFRIEIRGPGGWTRVRLRESFCGPCPCAVLPQAYPGALLPMPNLAGVDCAEVQWMGAQRATELPRACTMCSDGTSRPNWLVRQPLEAGHYRATFAVYDVLPRGCEPSTFCNHYQCGAEGLPGMVDPDEDICPSEHTIAVEFDLPAAGDVSVDVPWS